MGDIFDRFPFPGEARTRREPSEVFTFFGRLLASLRFLTALARRSDTTTHSREQSIQSAFRCMANADWKTFNCIKSFISPRAKRERTTGFSSSSSAKKRGRRSIVSSSSSSFRPLKMMCVLFLSSLSLSLSQRARSVSTVFKAHVRWEYSPSVRRSQTFAFGAQTEERRFVRNHREKKHPFFIRTLSSSSNFVAHYSLFLLTQYIRRPVRVDDAKT